MGSGAEAFSDVPSPANEARSIPRVTQLSSYLRCLKSRVSWPLLMPSNRSLSCFSCQGLLPPLQTHLSNFIAPSIPELPAKCGVHKTSRLLAAVQFIQLIPNTTLLVPGNTSAFPSHRRQCLPTYLISTHAIAALSNRSVQAAAPLRNNQAFCLHRTESHD